MPEPKRPMRIVVDENIPGVEETFARHGQIVRTPGRHLDRATLRDADALVVRSVTRVGPELLAGSRVRFVGSTTIGTDHLDREWLERRAIRWANAPGCNADAAAQYTLAMMLLAARRLEIGLADRRIGIVGRGNVGSRLVRLLRALGARRIAICDPPLASAGEPGLCGLDTIARCEVVSLHVPLTREGRWPTLHLLNGRFLARLPAATLVVNTSRGAVIDAAALSDWLAGGRGFAALDVWPDEPDISPELVRAATVATPHVAGYSLDGRLRGTLQVYSAFRDWLGLEPEIPDLQGSPGARRLPRAAVSSVTDAVLAACPVERDDASLRSLAAHTADLGAGFDALRKAYPTRRDFAGWRLPAGLDQNLEAVLRNLGFH